MGKTNRDRNSYDDVDKTDENFNKGSKKDRKRKKRTANHEMKNLFKSKIYEDLDEDDLEDILEDYE